MNIPGRGVSVGQSAAELGDGRPVVFREMFFLGLATLLAFIVRLAVIAKVYPLF